MNCESQKVACSLSILVLVFFSLLDDFRYGKYQLYRFADISAMFLLEAVLKVEGCGFIVASCSGW